MHLDDVAQAATHPPETPMSDHSTLQQLADVKGQLSAVMTMLTTQHETTRALLAHQHTATNQRIDDLRTSMGNQHEATSKRIDGVSTRVSKLEDNERATALKAATTGALTGGLVGVLFSLLKIKTGI